MPEINPTAIFSFSSEDGEFPASNLLKNNAAFKWKCRKPGEKEAIVEFQFSHAVEFYKIDIGNESSAYIEILAKRTSDVNADYQPLLSSTIFATPQESLQNDFNKLTRVKMLSSKDFNRSVAKEKWDRIRIVCTQPFNPALQYGLSFVKFYCVEEESNRQSNTTATTTASNSSSSSTSNDLLLPGALFSAMRNNRNLTADVIQNQLPVQLPIVASPSNVSSQTSVKIASSKKTVTSRRPPSSSTNASSVNRSTHLQTPPPTSSLSGAAATSNSVNRRTTTGAATTPTTTTTTTSSSSSRIAMATTSAATGTSATSSSNATNSVPFNKLFENVIFVMSGFQNPLRSQLRDKALKMGGKFRPDWSADCTHLICAFESTPKFQAVKGKGRIVTAKWITDCFEKRQRLAWRPYRLGRAPTPPSRSPPPPLPPPSRPAPPTAEVPSKKRLTQDADSTQPKRQKTDDDDVVVDDVVDDDDERLDNETVQKAEADENSGEIARNVAEKEEENDEEEEEIDTDEEVERAQRQIASAASSSNAPDKKTSDNNSNNVDAANDTVWDNELPLIFNEKHFFIYCGEMSSSERRFVTRLIVGFGGSVDQYMSEFIDFVVTGESWGSEFDEALKQNSKLIFVKPEWIYACDKEGAWTPHENFTVNK